MVRVGSFDLVRSLKLGRFDLKELLPRDATSSDLVTPSDLSVAADPSMDTSALDGLNADDGASLDLAGSASSLHVNPLFMRYATMGVEDGIGLGLPFGDIGRLQAVLGMGLALLARKGGSNTDGNVRTFLSWVDSNISPGLGQSILELFTYLGFDPAENPDRLLTAAVTIVRGGRTFFIGHPGTDEMRDLRMSAWSVIPMVAAYDAMAGGDSTSITRIWGHIALVEDSISVSRAHHGMVDFGGKFYAPEALSKLVEGEDIQTYHGFVAAARKRLSADVVDAFLTLADRILPVEDHPLRIIIGLKILMEGVDNLVGSSYDRQISAYLNKSGTIPEAAVRAMTALVFNDPALQKRYLRLLREGALDANLREFSKGYVAVLDLLTKKLRENAERISIKFEDMFGVRLIGNNVAELMASAYEYSLRNDRSNNVSLILLGPLFALNAECWGRNENFAISSMMEFADRYLASSDGDPGDPVRRLMKMVKALTFLASGDERAARQVMREELVIPGPGDPQ